MEKCIPVVQVGSFALRDPITREFLPAVPLYIEKTERAAESEAVLLKDIAHIFADKARQYSDGCELIGDKTTADALRPDEEQPADDTAAAGKPHRARSRAKK